MYLCMYPPLSMSIVWHPSSVCVFDSDIRSTFALIKVIVDFKCVDSCNLFIIFVQNFVYSIKNELDHVVCIWSYDMWTMNTIWFQCRFIAIDTSVSGTKMVVWAGHEETNFDMKWLLSEKERWVVILLHNWM